MTKIWVNLDELLKYSFEILWRVWYCCHVILIIFWRCQTLEILNSILTLQEGVVKITLLPQSLNDHFHLVLVANDVFKLVVGVTTFIGRKRIAACSWEKDVIIFSLATVVGDDFHEFVEATAEAPHVWRCIILLLEYRYLRCTIPPWANMAGQAPFFTNSLLFLVLQFVCNNLLKLLLLTWLFHYILLHNGISHPLCITTAFSNTALWHGPWETKVTDFYLTIFIYKNVWWLNIPVDDISWVNIF